ncbi:D-sedoheptulose 7-phosphate isomerase [Derxia lacustris]|uniref:D-sedoheptulose 7-phosphate isomerase n=1 Tax=Derxia lacustris TaxID=764842 RepID=UPI000A17813C|nr:D-sedoheptulose 7-phosphate isomerase [Derxia lacustris]
MIESIRRQIGAAADHLAAIQRDEALLATLEAIARDCVAALQAGNKILFMGNGGSAADAQHLAGELVSRFEFDRPGLAAFALTTDSSVLTAIGNDYGYEKLFARQVQAVGKAGDVLIGITTSGRSPNVIAALALGRQLGLRTVGFTGARPAAIDEVVDHCLKLPSTCTPRIQEGHILLGHTLCSLIESALFTPPAAA